MRAAGRPAEQGMRAFVPTGAIFLLRAERERERERDLGAIFAPVTSRPLRGRIARTYSNVHCVRASERASIA